MEEKIRKLIEKDLQKEKISVVDIYFMEEYSGKNLYIIIDKKPYVDIDTCVLATNIINPILDKEDLIEESYILNVCSKGEDE